MNSKRSFWPNIYKGFYEKLYYLACLVKIDAHPLWMNTLHVISRVTLTIKIN